MIENKIHIGTSGWNYKHWKDNFYPAEIKQEDFLEYYAKNFQTVEVNNTFYKLPEEKTIKNWVNTVPENFIFSVKGSRYITHMKQLKDPEESIEKFFNCVESFNGRLGPLLFQFSPRFTFKPERLGNFIKVLPKNYRYTFEFRNPNCFNDLTYNFLKDNNIAFCIHYLGKDKSPEEITSDFVYIRFHGTNVLGSGEYSEDQLRKFAENINNYRKQGKEVFCYFNNDENAYAVKNAKRLKELTENGSKKQ